MVPFQLIDEKGQADLYYLGIDNTRATYQQGDMAGLITGGFLKDTGPAGNVAFSNVGIDYKF